MTNGHRIREVATGLVLALAGVVLLVELAETPRVPVSDPLGPHGLPRVLAGGLVLVGVLLLVGAWWRWRRPGEPAEPEPAEPEPGPEPPPDLEPPPDPEAAPAEPAGRPRGWLVTALTIGATAGYVFALTRLGFVIATGLLGFLLLPLLGARRWQTVVGVPVGLTAVLWFVFGYVLDVGLPGFMGSY